MTRESVPSHAFSIVICTLGRGVLIVQERKHEQRWYFPAGRLDLGESFVDAAVRETLEEASIAVRLTGIVRVLHTPSARGARHHVIFHAHPADDQAPKQSADEESLRAEFYTLDEMQSMLLRGPEVLKWSRYVLSGGLVTSLELLSSEDTL